MKHFIKNTLMFFLVLPSPLLIVEFSIQALKENIFKESTLEKQYKLDANTYAWVDKFNNESLNIVAGSSSVKYGLSCTELNELNPDSSKYINIANDARGPIQTYFILKNIHLNNIQNIYFGLDPWIYTKRYYKHRNKYLYLDFTFFECLQYTKQHDNSAFRKRYYSLFNIILNLPLKKYSKNKNIPKDFGSAALHRKPVNFNNLNDSFQIDKYGWSNLQFEYLKKIESLCTENKIKLNLFIPPKRSDYTKHYKDNYKKTHKDYTYKIAENGIKSPFFGKFNILDTKGDSTLFAEAYHLNEKGQIKFSKLFYEFSLRRNEKYSPDYNWFTEDKTQTHDKELR